MSFLTAGAVLRAPTRSDGTPCSGFVATPHSRLASSAGPRSPLPAARGGRPRTRRTWRPTDCGGVGVTVLGKVAPGDRREQTAANRHALDKEARSPRPCRFDGSVHEGACQKYFNHHVAGSIWSPC